MTRWQAAVMILGIWPAAAWSATPMKDAVVGMPSTDFGFLSPENYKLDPRIKNLLVRDIDGDGKSDIIVVNNLKNRIDVLAQRKDPSDPAAKAPDRHELSGDINELPSDLRLEHRKIPLPREVDTLEVKDVNGDGRADLVYTGDPPGLYIQYQDADGEFSKRRSFEKSDTLRTAWTLDIGDLNGDDKDDIAFLGKQNLYIAYQGADGKLEDPKQFRLSEEGASLVRILDFDQDGHNDVVYLSDDPQTPVRIRFQTETGGRLGPEKRFAIDPPRGVSYADLDGKKGLEMLTISNLSDRFLVYGMQQAEKDESAPTSKMVTFPFEKSGSSPQADLLVADFDGDKRQDVLVTDADAARVMLYRQTEKQGLDLGQAYPAMMGTTVLREADIDGDGKAEALSLSSREHAIGMSRFDGGRLTYPQALPTRDEPVVMATLGSGKETKVAYLARVADRATGRDQFFLRMLQPTTKEGKTTWSTAKIGDAEELKLDVTGKPFDLRVADANADGHSDLMFFFMFDPSVLVWLGDGKGTFAPAPKTSQANLGSVAPAAVFTGNLGDDKNVLLVAQSNFARRLKLEKDGHWGVLDQFNASDTTANVTGIVTIDLDGDKVPELAMYDRVSQTIFFLKREDGVYRRWRQLKVSSYALRGMRVADFDGDQRDDLLMFDGDKMGIAFTGKQDLELRQLASYETDIRKGKLFDMVPGDLNGDNILDVLLIEPAQHHLEIVTMLPGNDLKRMSRWKVFEEKTFRQNILAAEPREAVIADVNNDNRNDIIILVHDRALVYLQDTGD